MLLLYILFQVYCFWWCFFTDCFSYKCLNCHESFRKMAEVIVDTLSMVCYLYLYFIFWPACSPCPNYFAIQTLVGDGMKREWGIPFKTKLTWKLMQHINQVFDLRFQFPCDISYTFRCLIIRKNKNETNICFT